MSVAHNRFSLHNLSLTGIAIRIISLCGLYQGWIMANIAWHNSPVFKIAAEEQHAANTMMTGGALGAWQMAGLTAALWFTAQIFDDLKANKSVNETLLKALSRIGLFLLLAGIPGIFGPLMIVGAPFGLQFNYFSFVLCCIAGSLMVVSSQVRRLRNELDAIV